MKLIGNSTDCAILQDAYRNPYPDPNVNPIPSLIVTVTVTVTLTLMSTLSLP